MPVGINLMGVIRSVIMFIKCYVFFIITSPLVSALQSKAVDMGTSGNMLSLINSVSVIYKYSLLISGGIALIYIVISGLGIESQEEVI